MEIPSAVRRGAYQSRMFGEEHAHSDSRFKHLMTPSRHSGLSSLSPKEPKSSLTMMSAFSRGWKLRMSE